MVTSQSPDKPRTAPRRSSTDVFERVRRREAALMATGRRWARTAGDVVPVEMPAAGHMVDGMFDFTEHLLDSQREFVHRVVTRTRTAVERGRGHRTRRHPRPTATKTATRRGATRQRPGTGRTARQGAARPAATRRTTAARRTTGRVAPTRPAAAGSSGRPDTAST